MEQKPIARLEELRLELAALHKDLGSMQDYLDRGRPSPEKKEQTLNSMREKERRLAEQELRYNSYLEALRDTAPAVLEAWIARHLEVAEAIIRDRQAADSPLAEKDLRVHLHVARKTAAEWQEVLDGTRNYVHINWYFTPDYEERMRDQMKS